MDFLFNFCFSLIIHIGCKQFLFHLLNIALCFILQLITRSLKLPKLPKLQSTSFWSQGILGVNMLRAFLHALCKSKFLYARIQPYGFFHIGLHISLEINIIFFLYLREMFVHDIFSQGK
jgi:hypothetical protein